MLGAVVNAHVAFHLNGTGGADHADSAQIGCHRVISFLGRFFPFIRTFMPFISGISGMRWSRFTPFSVLGGLCWSTLFTLLGYFFGGIPAVQKHFELVIIAILVLSLIPTIVGLLKAKFGKEKPAAEDTAETADAE